MGKMGTVTMNDEPTGEMPVASFAADTDPTYQAVKPHNPNPRIR
jgi:hypothetical protein